MKEYIVEVPYSGYIRGYDRYVVQANSEEEAITMVDVDGTHLDRIVTCDDTESYWEDSEVIG